MAQDSNLLSMAQQFSGLPLDSLISGPLNAAASANAAMALTQTKFMLDTCFKKVRSKITTPASGTTPAVKTQEATYDPTKPDSTFDIINYEPIMISMSLKRGVVTPGTPAIPASGTNPAVPAVPPKMDMFVTAFDLPLLTIVPLNSLAVDTVDIKFEMEVKSSFSNTQAEEQTKKAAGEASLEAKIGYGPFSATITGKASYSSEDRKTSNTHYEQSNSAKYNLWIHAGQLPLPKGVNVIIDAFAGSIQPYEMPAPV